jgi:hypothetical protein
MFIYMLTEQPKGQLYNKHEHACTQRQTKPGQTRALRQ